MYERVQTSTRKTANNQQILTFGERAISAIVSGCGLLDATNAPKHSIDQSKDRILQINQSKNASKHS